MRLDPMMSPRPLQPLHTGRLRLEPLEARHAAALYGALHDASLYEFSGDHAPESLEALTWRYRRLETRTSPDGREAWLNWALWSLPDAAYVGLIQATVHPDRTASVAYVLFREAWSRGYAREATAALIDALSLAWGVREMWAAVDVRHRRSIALLEELGFLRMVRRHAGFVQDAPSDEYLYCLSLDPPPFAFLA
jgi:RimJ/RimL family protein N-acetyltransferase